MRPPVDAAGRFLPHLRTASTIKRCSAKFFDAMFAGVTPFTLLALTPLPYASSMQPDNRRWGVPFAGSRVVDR